MRVVCVGAAVALLVVAACKNPAELTQQFGSGTDAGLAPPPDPRCGNGIVDTPARSATTATTSSGDGCSADCKSDETCGNGIVDVATGEVCDDGNNGRRRRLLGRLQVGRDVRQRHRRHRRRRDLRRRQQRCGDGCSANCQSNETCGNGIVDRRRAVRRRRTSSRRRLQRPNCTFARCGDGIVNHAANEACDDGNKSNTDACLNSCAVATCGDGFLEAGVEQCDDSNTKDGDGCDHNCKIEAMINPSFEMSYASWTLQQTEGTAAWGIGSNGQTITGSDTVLDLEYMQQITAECLGLTGNLVIDATNGTQAAFNIQFGPDDHRLYQTVNIPATATRLLFDIAYRNAGQFVAGQRSSRSTSAT